MTKRSTWRRSWVSAALLAAFALTPLPAALHAQTTGQKTSAQAPNQTGKRLVTGVITDDSGNPLIGAHVRIKGQKRGSITNVNGQYSLQVGSAKTQLQVSYMGMKTRTIDLPEGNRPLQRDVMLTTSDNLLGEAVITNGYHKIDPRNNTAAITSVKMDDILMPNMTTIDMALEGRIPDLVFTNNSGEAGATGRVRVRGTSTIIGNREPLWVLDGFVLQDPVNVSTDQLNDPDYINYVGNAISGINPKTSTALTCCATPPPRPSMV